MPAALPRLLRRRTRLAAVLACACLAAAAGAPPTATTREAWVESQLAALSQRQRIGQLFFARAHSDGSEGTLAEVRALVTDHYVGGVVFFSGTPARQAAWTNDLQASAKTPLLIAMDAEWGAAMRFPGLPRFPYALTLGAANDPDLARRVARETGRQLNRLGVHVSFAPVADLNVDPANPVIGRRSFGEDPLRAGRLAQAYARGLADAGVLAVAKHFPGHGNTAVDSHVALPVLAADRAALDAAELVPFRMLAQDGIAGVMTGHLHVPAVDARDHRPASLSAALTRDILRGEWDYRGLIVTDGLDMAGVADHFGPGQLAVEALLAGNDVLLIPRDIPAGIAAVERALNDGTLTPERVDASVRRLLRAKYDAGLHRAYAPLRPNGIDGELRSPLVADLNQEAYRAAVTTVRANTLAPPILRVDTLDTAVLSLGAPAVTPFQRAALRYAPAAALNIVKPLSAIEQQRWAEQLSTEDLVVVGLHDLSWSPGEDYGLLPSHLAMLRRIPAPTRVVVVVFGSPYALDRLADFDNLVLAYEDTPAAQAAAAEVLYGATAGLGTLPVSTRLGFGAGAGLTTPSSFRLQFSTPGNAGFSASKLREIDRLAAEAIRTRATPGGVVLAAKDGQVGYLKAYGRHTYAAASPPVDEDTVYDLASITKVAAATLALMRLHERGELSVYDRLEDHLPALRGTNKGQLVLQDVVAHQARLKPWIPFYERTLTDARPGGKRAYKPGLYASSATGRIRVPVTERLYITDAFRDSIYQLIADSDLRARTGYRYSDLGFYLVAEIVRAKTGLPLDEYVAREFYRPLGLRTMGYRPLERIARERVPPTEEDDYFRYGRVQGYVHDMGAAMLGGVSGHAGLFSDAVDLAVVMQMLLNDGYYGGRRYFRPETVRLFTTRHPRSTRRALGWDMPELSSRGSTNVSPLASAKTFGHLGFTGTCAWADPETGIVFVWLTNRTYPKMSPNRFGKENYRPRMQSAAYEAAQ